MQVIFSDLESNKVFCKKTTISSLLTLHCPLATVHYSPIHQFTLPTYCALKTGADIVATACPGCITQIKGGLTKAGDKIEVKHIAEILGTK